MLQESLFTAEQMELIKRQGAGYGADTVEQMEEEFTEILKKIKFEMSKGTPAHAPEIQKIVKRWNELINMFSAYDPEITEIIKLNYEKFFDRDNAQQVDPKVFQYIRKASTQS